MHFMIVLTEALVGTHFSHLMWTYSLTDVQIADLIDGLRNKYLSVIIADLG